jgi:two-component system sensor histidine kinase YesM
MAAMRDLKIQEKIFVCFVIIIMISVISIGVLSYYKSSSILGEKVSKYNYETVQQISTNVEYTLQRIDEQSSILAFDQSIQTVLNMNPDLLDERTKISIVNMIESIMITNYNSNLMRSIDIYGNNGMRFQIPSSYDNRDSEMDIKKFIQISKHYQGKNKWVNDIDKKGILHAVREIRDLRTTKPLGMIIISLKVETISNMLEKVNFDKSGTIIIMDEHGDFITPVNDMTQSFQTFSNTKELFHSHSGSSTQEMADEQFFLSYHTSEYTGWKIIGLISLDKLYKDNYKIRNWIVVFTLIILILAFLLARVLAKSISNPLKRMLKPMKRAEMGDFKVSLPVYSKDEIGIISESFNHMISQINSLIEVVYKEKLLLKESEFKALQAQINPHFLYNTLETVNWMAKINGIDEICKVITALGDLMRISISKDKEYLTIREEEKYIRDYLFIQKTRFGNKIHCQIDIEESIMSIKIPKLIIQPIVENALVHGIQRRKGIGLIKIKGFRVDASILFEIEDTGVGMTNEQIYSILNTNNDLHEGTRAGVGIINVHQRIQHIYGKDCGLEIKSSPGEGTMVRIKVTNKLSLSDENEK